MVVADLGLFYDILNYLMYVKHLQLVLIVELISLFAGGGMYSEPRE